MRGHWRRAQDLAGRSIDEVLRSDTKQVAADYLAEAALRGAVFDQYTRSKAAAMQALALEHTPSTNHDLPALIGAKKEYEKLK